MSSYLFECLERKNDYFLQSYLARKVRKVFSRRTNKYSAPKEICEATLCKNAIPIPI